MEWFRFYTEAISDTKIRRLPPAQRWLWVVMLSLARKSNRHFGWLEKGEGGVLRGDSNLVTACVKCNKSKWVKTPEEWRA
ncbi:MAG: hypothetical protein K6T83_06760 [Alicyclobacillus sp.]|nr:hypothetical protein [Alicyclobacillus sp.]